MKRIKKNKKLNTDVLTPVNDFKVFDDKGEQLEVFCGLQTYCAECKDESCVINDIDDITGYCLNCEKIVDACDYLGNRREDLIKERIERRKQKEMNIDE